MISLRKRQRKLTTRSMRKVAFRLKMKRWYHHPDPLLLSMPTPDLMSIPQQDLNGWGLGEAKVNRYRLYTPPELGSWSKMIIDAIEKENVNK